MKYCQGYNVTKAPMLNKKQKLLLKLQRYLNNPLVQLSDGEVGKGCVIQVVARLKQN